MKQLYQNFLFIFAFFGVTIGTTSNTHAQNAISDSLFESISQVDYVHARTGNKVLHIDARSGSKIGYRKLIPVKAGQEIIAETYALYEKKKNKLFKALVNTIGAAASTQLQYSPSPTIAEGPDKKNKQFPFVGIGIAIAPNIFRNTFKKIPDAAIQYNLYDEDSSFVRSYTSSVNRADSDQWQLLRLEEKVDKDGFIEVILINKSRQTVWFDDLVITIAVNKLANQGPVINSEPLDPPSTFNTYNVFVRAFAPPGSFNGYGFRDDGRGFSLVGSATSRIKQDYTISPDGVNPFLSGGYPRSDETYTTAGSLAAREEPTGYAQITSFNRGNGANNARVKTSFEGSNPFFPFNGAPDIEVESQITFSENYEKTRLSLSITLNTKRFPATELIIVDKSGNQIFLIADGAYGGPIDLTTRSKFYYTVTATISINISSDGNFISVYRTGQVSQTYSIASWNQQFTSQYPGPY